jgi:hypothetical protein
MSRAGCEFGIERTLVSFYPGVVNFKGRRTGTWETRLDNWIAYLGLEKIVQSINYDAGLLTKAMISKGFRGTYDVMISKGR